MSLYPMSGERLKNMPLKILSQEVRNWVRQSAMSKTAVTKLRKSIFLIFGHHKLFKGKITDVLRETRGAFNFGKVMLWRVWENAKGIRRLWNFRTKILQLR